MRPSEPFVIRHGIDDLPKEHKAFGQWEFWPTNVPHASDAEVELVLRMDRTLRLLKDLVAGRPDRTNDPQFSVGWQHLDHKVDEADRCLTQLPTAKQVVPASHVKAIRKLRADVGDHSKMRAVAALVATVVAKWEKVLLFCHHHATAQELTRVLAAAIPQHAKIIAPRSAWKAAWATAHSDLTLSSSPTSCPRASTCTGTVATSSTTSLTRARSERCNAMDAYAV